MASEVGRGQSRPKIENNQSWVFVRSWQKWRGADPFWVPWNYYERQFVIKSANGLFAKGEQTV